MRKFLVAATLTAMILIPAAARAGFLVEASLGQGYQTAPTPRGWEQTNLNIAPGYAPSLPVLVDASAAARYRHRLRRQGWHQDQPGISADALPRAADFAHLRSRDLSS
jgi:hypothetical protein